MTTTSPGEIPIAIGLMLCDQVIVDKDTQKPSPIGIFTGLGVEDFDEPQRLSVFAALTNSRGDAKMELVIFHLETGDQIYQQTYAVRFSDPLQVVNIITRVRRAVFPGSGWYDVVLRIGGEPIAQRRLRVYQIHGS
jgi:hypothetical protein